MPYSVAQILASLVQARQNCRGGRNPEWYERHERTIERVVKAYMPSGSGVDSGTQIDLDLSSVDKLVFYTSFHHMHESGMYDGWTEHTVRVRPAFDGFTIGIGGRDRNEIKDHLTGIFDMALRYELTDEQRVAIYQEPTS